MVAYVTRRDVDDDGAAPDAPVAAKRRMRKEPRHALARDMLHGLTPDEFDVEAKSVADAEALTPQVRERLRTQLIERLKTPIDPPSWGPDWIRKGSRGEPLTRREDRNSEDGFSLRRLFGWLRKDEDDAEEEGAVANGNDNATRAAALEEPQLDDAQIIAHNMEKSRQVYHFRSLYVLAALAAITIIAFGMFIDFQIIKGDIWTRALANEFMVVPQSLQGTLLFKSLQVVFAVLIIHFMLKITGRTGRNVMITTAFLFALVMIGCLGYLVAYNNMAGGTSTALEHAQSQPQSNSIDRLFASSDRHDAAPDGGAGVMPASMTSGHPDSTEPSLQKPSEQFLANVDSWFWLAFASVIFFIVTTVAALYMQVFENNIRNFLISRDYLHRRKQFAQLHLLELAEQRE
jgi:hypothetical protein